MPTYQYRCTECGHDLEAVQKFSDAALTECPSCGGSLRKVYNAVGVVFKGSGFYRTDSRAGSGEDKPAAAASEPAASSSDGGSGVATSGGSGDKAAAGSGTEGGAKTSGSKDGGANGSGRSKGGVGKAGASSGSSAA